MTEEKQGKIKKRPPAWLYIITIILVIALVVINPGYAIGGAIAIMCASMCWNWASKIKANSFLAYFIGFFGGLLGLLGYYIYYKKKLR